MVDSTEGQFSNVTELLQRVAAGDRSAENELLPQIYADLKHLAAAQLRNERQGHSLQVTALVHEAYVRLTGGNLRDWKDRSHFFAVAARVMRRVLVDHARGRRAAKRGGGGTRVVLEENLLISPQQSDLVAALDEALERLAEIDPRKAEIVELRFFGGLTEEEIAAYLGRSSRTVKRDWVMARAWLYGELSR
jgi:RNA polymerase sigma factor (TIGR02999 family)